MTRTAKACLIGGVVFLAGCGGQTAYRSRSDASSVQGWQALAPLGGGARQETGVAALGGLIYAIGGFITDLSIVSWVEAYDPSNDTWTQVAPIPQPLHHANTAVAGDRLYVLGALVGTSFTAIGNTYVYDPKTDSWSSLSPMPAGTQRGAGGTAVIGKQIFVAGGYRQGRSVADFSVYDTVNDTWEILPGLGEPRDHLVAGAVEGKFYAVGGRRDGSLRGNVDEFDPATIAWSAKTPMPTARAGTAGAVVANRILVAGGEGNRFVPSGVFPDLEAYDPQTDSWEILEPMLTPRHGTGAASINNVFYVPGGAIRQGFGAADTNEAYTR